MVPLQLRIVYVYPKFTRIVTSSKFLMLLFYVAPPMVLNTAINIS